MNTIDRVLELLNDLRLPHRVNGQSVTVDPTSPNGFSVSFEIRDDTWTVSGDGWHQHFDFADQASNENEALACFKSCLTGETRLRVRRRGQTEYRWVLERQTEVGWRAYSSTGLFFFPFWSPLEICDRVNSFARAADSTP
jgi:hypothetical protein